MVPSFQNLALDHALEPLQIDDVAGHRVHFAGHRDLQRVVVPVAVAIGAAAEDLFVFLRRPRRIPVVVRGREGRTPG